MREIDFIEVELNHKKQLASFSANEQQIIHREDTDNESTGGQSIVVILSYVTGQIINAMPDLRQKPNTRETRTCVKNTTALRLNAREKIRSTVECADDVYTFRMISRCSGRLYLWYRANDKQNREFSSPARCSDCDLANCISASLQSEDSRGNVPR